MGTYTNIVSSAKPINAIRTFIGGVAKDITSAWTFVNGVRKQVFPTTEAWTLVYSKTNGGNYSYSAGWGKYKIEISGGGGSGGASCSTHSDYRNWANNGSNGELVTTYANVASGNTLTFSGKVGTGGQSSSASYTMVGMSLVPSATVGAGGTGYANGNSGNSGVYQGSGVSAAAAGAGGGSTSLVYSGTTKVAKGGNGGDCDADEIKPQRYGGKGGSGGVSSGSGASGGSGVFGYKQAATSGAGTNGYVKIYKSNIYPA